MDIYKEWAKITKEKFESQPIKKEEIMTAISKESILTIYELKKRLKYKIYWALFFIVLFGIWLLFSLNFPPVIPLLSLAVICYVVGAWTLYVQYRKMEGHIDPALDTLSAMRNSSKLMKRALFFENLFGLIAVPVLFFCGALLPRLYKGESIIGALSDGKMVLILLAVLVVLLPIVHYGGKKLNDIAYGSYMRKLDENIRRIEEIIE